MPFDVTAIGSATKDVFLKLPAGSFPRDWSDTLTCFPLGAKIEVKDILSTTGGGATNAAVTFARQGLKTALLARVGDDLFGQEIKTALTKNKVTVKLIFDKKVDTDYSTVIVSSSGDRTVLVHRGASSSLKAKDIKNINSKWFYINPSSIPITEMSQIIKTIKNPKNFIAFNPSRDYLNQSPKILSILKSVSVLLVNKEEAGLLTNLPLHRSNDIFKKLDKIIPGLVIMTDGPRGLFVSDGRILFQAGIFKNKSLIDRTGAGDAFGSGFVSILAQAKSKPPFSVPVISEAIRFGSANATSVVESLGAKAGIISYSQFKKTPRWRHLPLQSISL